MFVLSCMAAATAGAQELRSSIQVQSASVQGTNKQVYESMRTDLTEFVNNMVWTRDRYDNIERIECNFVFNITEQISSNEFKGKLNVQLRRPVYNSAYSTAMLNIEDANVQFKYTEGQALTYSTTGYDSDNLVPLIAFYVYMALGVDYDSFSLNGGSEFYTKAEAIVSSAQSSQYSGWKSFESTQNRYWLNESVLSESHRAFRKSLYDYHRQGLDKMHANPEQARTAIYNAIDNLRKVKRSYPRNSYMLNQFFTCKADEIVNIFSEAPVIEKNKIVEILTEVDPANISKYEKIKFAK